MSAERNERLLSEFRRRQRAMYAGGDLEPVAELLAEDVVWRVPGRSPIAGEHRGRASVLRYFEQRRALARGTLRIEVRKSIADDDAVVELADGRARLGGAGAHWRTVGVYRIQGGRIAEAWLIPFDLEAFDRVWSRAPTSGARIPGPDPPP
jgi:uncharacterized protein